jgi:superfamily I DNA/RNA helicase
VQARGRTTILRINYRNTNEILDYAYRFAKHYLIPADSDEDHIPLIEPRGAGRHGPKPYLKQLTSFDEEARYLAHTLKRLNENGMQWLEMCVTYRSHWMGESLYKALEKEGIPNQWLASSGDKKSFRPGDDSVKLMTMHSSKGLEFPLVAVAGLGYLPGDNHDLAAEAKLLYVAMTRSTDKLLLTCHQSSEFVRLLAENQ